MGIPQYFACLLITWMYYFKINILLQNVVDQTIFEGVVAIFDRLFYEKVCMLSSFILHGNFPKGVFAHF